MDYKIKTLVMVLLIGSISSCNNEPFLESIFKSYSFEEDQQGWQVAFAGYPVNQEANYQLSYGVNNLPQPNNNRKGLWLSGSNQGNNLFLFTYIQINNLIPDQQYSLSINLALATNRDNATSEYYLKVGTLSHTPKTIISENVYQPDFDKGVASKDGEDLKIIGDLANSNDGIGDALHTLSNQKSIYIKPDNNGTTYIVVGLDTNSPGLTSIFFDNIDISLKPISG